MKKNNLIYWISTTILSLMMLMSGFNYFTNNEMKAAFTHLGFPDYFRIELAVAKIAAALVLLIPALPAWSKQLAYSGLAITFVSAFIAHNAVQDPITMAVVPLVFLAVLIVSYLYYTKRTTSASIVS